MRFFLLIILSVFSFCSCQKPKKETLSPKILVSILPEKYIVEKIAGENFNVDFLVPAGASPHHYEPSPHKLFSTAQSVVWFRIGEGFENRAMQIFKEHNPQMKIVDLREGIELLPFCCGHSHAAHDIDAHDSHIWLSPRILKKLAISVSKNLTELYPEHAQEFAKNSEKLIEKLDLLDAEIISLFEKSPTRVVLVSHPAFSYFCRDYHLKQLSIEIEGKDPTIKQLSQLLDIARKEEIRFVYIQQQYNTKAAMLIAEELQAETIVIDPYKENVLENLQTIAQAFSQS